MQPDIGLLIKKRKGLGRVIEKWPDSEKEIFIFDLTRRNKELAKVINGTASEKDAYVKKSIKHAGAKIGIGKYLEKRPVYKWSKIYDGGRDIHLGVDIFARKGARVLAFSDAKVHSFKDNSKLGDYGPTIILEHKIDNQKFYSLYGHLSKSSLRGKKKGQKIRKGETIGRIGGIYENGSWPEHVHFELIKDMQGRQGNFPGVASSEKIEKYKKLCICPNFVLRIGKLH